MKPVLRSARFAALTAGAALALGGVGGAAAVAACSANAATHSVHHCTTKQLAVSFDRADHGAGSVFLPVVLTNRSQQTCTISGYVGVRLLGEHNRRLATHVQRVAEARGTIVLRPGQSALAVLQWVENQQPAVHPQAIAIRPPHGGRAVIAGWQGDWGVVSRHTIYVRPLQPAAS